MIKSKTKSIIFFAFLVLIFLADLIFINFLLEKQEEFYSGIFNRAVINFSEIKKLRENRTAILIFVGDIILDRGVKYMVNREDNGDWKFPFLKIANFLRKADILFGNLESIISDKGEKVGSIYSFRAEPEAIKGLIFAGFDIVSVANNHTFDYGREAMEDHFKRLKEARINYVGGGFNKAEAQSPVIKEVAGTKIAFLGYTNLGSEYWKAEENKSGIAWLTENIAEDIKKTKEIADLVMVSFHWGEEYQKVTEEQEFFGHLAIDSGADLVVGHHPHIVQEIEEYKEKYIFYSLGNFVFDQSFSEETMQGLLVKVKVDKAGIKEIISQSIKINEFFQPEVFSTTSYLK